MNEKRMTIGSCFSGIGGELVAATMLGWEVKFHCEINPFGRHVLDYWFPKSKSYEDITKTDFTEWRGRSSLAQNHKTNSITPKQNHYGKHQS